MRLLFDDLVGAGEDKGWDRQAKVLRGPEVHDEIELDRLLDRQVSGLGALQDAIDIVGRPMEVVRNIRPIGHQAAVVGIVALRIDRRQMRLVDQRYDVLAKMIEHAVRKNDYSVGSGKNGWAQRVQYRGALGLDPAEVSQTKRPRGRLGLLEIFRRPVRWVHQSADRGDLWKGRAQQLQTLAVELGVHEGKAGDIPARSREA